MLLSAPPEEGIWDVGVFFPKSQILMAHFTPSGERLEGGFEVCIHILDLRLQGYTNERTLTLGIGQISW